MNQLETRLQAMATQAAAAHGCVLVCARMVSGRRQTLEVLLETPEGTSPTLDTCTAVSKTLARALDEADPIKGRYTLEVGSPGLERPLLTPADYVRFAGKHAKVRLKTGENLSGVIENPTPETVCITNEYQPTTVHFSNIFAAHLSPTKAEMDAWMKQATQRKGT